MEIHVLEKQTLVVACGWPMSGKTTISKRLKETLRIHWVDADPVWVLNFGEPNPNPQTEEEIKKDGMEVRRTYQLLIMSASLTLEMGRSLIISAPFSRSVGWSDLVKMLEKFPEVALKVIWCKPKGDNDSEISSRLKDRIFGVNCWSSVNTQARYENGRSRFENLLFRTLSSTPLRPTHQRNVHKQQSATSAVKQTCCKEPYNLCTVFLFENS